MADTAIDRRNEYRAAPGVYWNVTDQTLFVRISVALSRETMRRLGLLCQVQEQQGIVAITLDLRHCFASSANSLDDLHYLARRARDHGGSLRIVHASVALRSMFARRGLDEIAEVVA